MSYDGDTNTVLKGVTHGAVDFLIKPVRLEELSNMWQHVVRKRRQQAADYDGSDAAPPCSHSGSDLDGPEQIGRGSDGGGSSRQLGAAFAFPVAGSSGAGDFGGQAAAPAAAAGGGNPTSTGTRKRSTAEERDGATPAAGAAAATTVAPQPTTKRPRVQWTSEMHSQFVAAVNRLGIDKAVPKKILELMTVEGLTRENVASHLQKYRLYLKKASRLDGSMMPGVSPTAQPGPTNSTCPSQRASIPPLCCMRWPPRPARACLQSSRALA